MGILDTVTSPFDNLAELARNPFPINVKPSIAANDFQNGFVITEILDSGQEGYKVSLKNQFMPKVPFKYGGKGRISKEFYPGRAEPTVQVLGSEEDDVTIMGELKEKKFTKDYAGIADEYRELLDLIRLRQNIVKIELGEWVRYGMINSTNWEISRINRIKYSITFLIIGFSLPTNPVYISNTKEIPFDVNKELIEAGENFVPDQEGVPFDIIDQIGFFTSEVASSIANVTNFVDSAFETVENLEKSVVKATLLIQATQNKLIGYKKRLGSFDVTNPLYSLAETEQASRYGAEGIRNAAGLTAILERLRNRFASIILQIPIARHLVREGDTLQALSAKYYGTPDNWEKIKSSNSLETNELVVGSTLEIPRV